MSEPEPLPEGLREAFLRFLTTDSDTKDRRRKEFNQAIFDADRGFAIFINTDLDMVMSKFDKAMRSAAPVAPDRTEGLDRYAEWMRLAARAGWPTTDQRGTRDRVLDLIDAGYAAIKEQSRE